MVLLNLNQAYPLFDGAAGEAALSAAVAMPVRATTFTWQSVFGDAPSAVSLAMLGSLDGVTFASIDTSTTVGGQIKTVNGNFTHVKAQIVSIADAADVSVLIVPKDL